MPTVHLQDRALVAVAGADAETLPAEHRHHRPRRARRTARRGPARCCRRRARSCSISWSRATGENGFLLECRADAGRRFRAPADALQAARQGRDRQAAIRRLSRFVGRRFSRSHKLIQLARRPIHALRDSRFVDRTVLRHYAGAAAADASEADWHALRIATASPKAAPTTRRRCLPA